MKQLQFQFDCSLPEDDYSCEQHEITVKDILAGNMDVSSPSLEYREDYDDDDDDFDEQCRLLNDVDRDYEQRLVDERNSEQEVGDES